ncbi:SGNH/GDSL hydrolase family protein [Pedobacter sp. SYP-B3415]|uniref:SGNH/GDSL hydrolase family protein n=1 Tax=Pedobacter sp. SYP-B3415 TaxID=2496641 RepID=UPI001F0EF9BF|nr:SGNH/GDSL hydrolase family protein [Pedobacter sp. SYP-B3415]
MSTHATLPPVKEQFYYLALGDSYTIGEAVKPEESFPFQLRDSLASGSARFAPPEVIAKTGWTTGELLSALHKPPVRNEYDLVTLLIGVNNQYRGYPPDVYKKEFSELLQKAIAYAGGRKERVFVISIPDWGVTPFAAASGRNKETIATEIDAYNAIAQKECTIRGIDFTDITPASRNAASDRTLLAEDGLHPSQKMYSSWVAAVFPKILRQF